MQVVLNKKKAAEITLFSVEWYLNLFFFFSFKKYALKNITIHTMCIFTKSIMPRKGKELNIYYFKIIK